METNIIEALKARRTTFRSAPNNRVGIVREIQSALPDGTLKKLKEGGVILLSKLPLGRGEKVLITLHCGEGPSERRGRVIDVTEVDRGYEVEVVFIH